MTSFALVCRAIDSMCVSKNTLLSSFLGTARELMARTISRSSTFGMLTVAAGVFSVAISFQVALIAPAAQARALFHRIRRALTPTPMAYSRTLTQATTTARLSRRVASFRFSPQPNSTSYTGTPCGGSTS